MPPICYDTLKKGGHRIWANVNPAADAAAAVPGAVWSWSLRKKRSFLHRLGECAFLPVIQEKEAPVFPEEPGKELLLQILEKKGLISLDYDKPLKDYHTPAYDASPVRGSMALTKRGQDVLELMEYQGVRS